VALGLTQPLTEMSFLGGKGGRRVGLTTLPPSCANFLEIWKPQPSVTLRACSGLQRDYFTFYSCITNGNTCISNASRFLKEHWFFGNVRKFRPFVLLVRAECWLKWRCLKYIISVKTIYL